MRPEAALALLLWAGAAAAEPGGQRMIPDDQAAAYGAVGRLNVAGNRHCTAVLISPSEVLTAAHCLFNPRTGRRAAPGAIRFVAGQRRDAYAALREVAATAIPPGYAPAAETSAAQIAEDIALLRLSAPIGTEAAPFPVADWPAGAALAIVAYGQDRAYAASIRDGCAAIGAEGGAVALDCAVTFGVSGAPVLAEGPDGPRVVAVVSAMGTGEGGEIAYVAPVAGHLAALRAALAARSSD